MAITGYVVRSQTAYIPQKILRYARDLTLRKRSYVTQTFLRYANDLALRKLSYVASRNMVITVTHVRARERMLYKRYYFIEDDPLR